MAAKEKVVTQARHIMPDWLSARAQTFPDQAAIIWSEGWFARQVSYSELNQYVAEFSAQLAAAGVKRGDNVAVLLPNYVGYAIVIHSLIRLGAVLVPLNIRMTAAELSYQIKQTNATHLIYNWFNVETAQAINLPDLTHLEVRLQPDNRLFIIDARDLHTPLYVPLDVLAEAAQPYHHAMINLDDIFCIMFTSGTTGKPKGAMLSYGNIFYSAIASAFRMGTLPDDRWLCVVPLYHIGGLSIILRGVLYGIEVDLRTFSVDYVNFELQRGSITLISLVPTMLYRLIEARGHMSWSPRLRLVLLGGAAATPDLLRMCRQLNIPIATTYGMSETASQVATTLPGQAMYKPGTVGKPLMFTSVRVVDDHGQDVPPNTEGEIVVKGPTVMHGYYKDREATKQTLRDGELYTGDIGYLDDEGDLWLLQRRSDLIVSGGENIYPAEIETVIRQHPAVQSVCVVGLPSEEWGQQVAAAVVLHQDKNLTPEVLETYTRERLAGYKQPRVIQFVDELPMTASGKISRDGVIQMLTNGKKP